MNLLSILFAVFLFGFMIAFHEFGHYITAKISGVKVNEFSIGMGPKIISVPKGETTYSLRLFPIGGFVSLEGEDGDSESERSFISCVPWKRIIILAAGGIMNVILGFILILILSFGQDAIGTRTVAGFNENSVSSEYLMVDDVITAINGESASCDYDIVYSLIRDQDGIVSIDVIRNNEKMHFDNVKFKMEEYEDGTKSIMLDFKVYGKENTFINAVGYSFKWTASLAKLVWRSLGDIIEGKFALNQLSGPVGVTNVISKATATKNIRNVMLIVGLITINLGIMNLLPLPALDGGRIVFVLIEMILGRPINRKAEAIIHAVGLAAFVLLSIIITYNDIVKLVTGG